MHQERASSADPNTFSSFVAGHTTAREVSRQRRHAESPAFRAIGWRATALRGARSGGAAAAPVSSRRGDRLPVGCLAPALPAGGRGWLVSTDDLVGQPVGNRPGRVEMEPGAQVGLDVLERPPRGLRYPAGEALDPLLHVGGLAVQFAGHPGELSPRLAEVDVAECADAPVSAHGHDATMVPPTVPATVPFTATPNESMVSIRARATSSESDLALIHISTGSSPSALRVISEAAIAADLAWSIWPFTSTIRRSSSARSAAERRSGRLGSAPSLPSTTRQSATPGRYSRAACPSSCHQRRHPPAATRHRRSPPEAADLVRDMVDRPPARWRILIALARRRRARLTLGDPTLSDIAGNTPLRSPSPSAREGTRESASFCSPTHGSPSMSPARCSSHRVGTCT